MTSAKLKWCVGFAKAIQLRGHLRQRVKKKNVHKVERMRDKAFRRWGCFPLPPEWMHPKFYPKGEKAMVYDTRIMKLEYENEDELRTLQAMYPNDDCPDDLPCPPPPVGDD